MKQILMILIGAVIMSSCTKVVIIELDDPEPNLVVESLITDANEPFRVKLSLVAPYFSSGNPVVDNAQVYISDDMGNIDTLFYNGNGFYLTAVNRSVVQGRTYTLKVIHDGVQYDAISRVPDYKMALDSITYVYHEQSTFFDEGYNIVINGQENPLPGDFIRFITYKNDTIQTDPFKYFISDDLYVNGNYIVAQVPFNFQSGDTARVEILSIDRAYYKYLYTISTQVANTGGPFDSAPANPPTNLNNGAVGYFAACSIDSKEKILP